MDNILGKLNEWLVLYGPKLLAAVAIFIIGRIMLGILIGVIRKIMNKANVDTTLTKFLLSLLKILLLTVIIIAALEALGVETTSFIAILGAAGLAIGFALQGSLSNFAAGVMLIIFRPFKAGDFVEAGGVSGIVEEIRIFNTVMRTADNKEIIIPNGNIMNSNIINYSAKETRRVDLVFGIGYTDDIKKAKEILHRLVKADSRILADPEPIIAVGELAESSVNFVVRPWVKSEDYWNVYWNLTEQVKLTFDAEGISIPFPQRDVHLFQENT